MNNPENRISRELAPEVFQLASELYAKKQQEYSLQELIKIGEEAQIPAEFIQQAVEIIQLRQTSQEIQVQKQPNKLKLALLGVAVTAGTLTLGGWAYHQISASKNHPESPVGILPDKRESKQTGNVELYLMNEEGLVNGILLNNGKQVKIPPHISKQLVNAVKPGDTVDVVGKLGNPSTYGQELEARIITNTQTKAIVAKQPKQKKEKKPEFNDFINLEINELVKHWLVNGKGEIKGAILTSGTQVHFAKPLAKNINKIAKPGSIIKAEGVGRKTENGSALKVISAEIDGVALPNGQ